jgi:hypothetical protein
MVDPIQVTMKPEVLRDLTDILTVKYPQGTLAFNEEFWHFYQHIVMLAGREMTETPADPYTILEKMRTTNYQIFATVFLTGWEAALLHLARRGGE